jgi:hypothetical protein
MASPAPIVVTAAAAPIGPRAAKGRPGYPDPEISLKRSGRAPSWFLGAAAPNHPRITTLGEGSKLVRNPG